MCFLPVDNFSHFLTDTEAKQTHTHTSLSPLHDPSILKTRSVNAAYQVKCQERSLDQHSSQASGQCAPSDRLPKMWDGNQTVSL